MAAAYQVRSTNAATRPVTQGLLSLASLQPSQLGRNRGARMLLRILTRALGSSTKQSCLVGVKRRRPVQCFSGLHSVRPRSTLLMDEPISDTGSLTLVSWGATFAIIVKEWQQGKVRGRRDPPFVNPVEHSHEASDTSSYYPARTTGIGARKPLTDVDEEEEPQSPFSDPPETRYAPSQPPTLPPLNTGPRQSMDTYGAFSDPAPTGFSSQPASPGVSRTMQYADPYAAVRANIGPRTGQSNGPPGYDY